MSARLPVGARRHLLTLEAPADAADDNGGVTRTYAAVAILWGRVTPKTDDMVFRADQQAENVTHEILVRAHANLTGAMRFRLGERLFQILGFDEADEKGATTRALCEEMRP